MAKTKNSVKQSVECLKDFLLQLKVDKNKTSMHASKSYRP